MKVRQGFVSNSSSSSFIVIGHKEFDIPSLNSSTLTVPDDLGGKTEFGWEIERSTDIGSRINFSYLQCLYSGQASHKEILEKVLKETFNISSINWELTLEGYYAYIDHQSTCPDNMEMFNSEETLKNFIFCKDSFIQTDNDNH